MTDKGLVKREYAKNIRTASRENTAKCDHKEAY